MVSNEECQFYIETFKDPYLTEHDIQVVADHMMVCVRCRHVIGGMINDRSGGNEAG